MSRILKAYETQFRWLLKQAGARKLNQGVQWLVDKAEQLRLEQRIPLADALTRTHQELAAKCRAQLEQPEPRDMHFFCDAGLGGLARWLRASGYEAAWEPGIDDDVLLKEAAGRSATLLTTDSMLMERRLLRERIIPALWLPPTLKMQQQLALVFRELGLAVRAPRCMSCGGKLVPVDKESVRERIPPRTYRWLDEYFICGKCGKLFWQGTHWQRIVGHLGRLGKN